MRQAWSALRQATLVSLFLVISALPARAQIAVDSQLWLQGVAIVNLSDNWRLHLEGQPRWDDDATQWFQIITRTAVGRRLNGRMSLWMGYAWVQKMRLGLTAHEQRLWQQFLTTLPSAGGWAPLLRIRTEQRFQDGWAESSHRVRIMGRAVRPLSNQGPWSAALWGESFFAFDETALGPPRGWDQHRLFGGVNHRFGPHANLDAGYLHVTARRRNLSAVNSPGALVTLNLVH